MKISTNATKNLRVWFLIALPIIRRIYMQYSSMDLPASYCWIFSIYVSPPTPSLSKNLPFCTAYYICSMTCLACVVLFLVNSQRGLSGTPLRMSRRDSMPITPIRNMALQFWVYPTTIVRSEAMVPPKCQVPSIPILTLPLYLGGKN